MGRVVSGRAWRGRVVRGREGRMRLGLVSVFVIFLQFRAVIFLPSGERDGNERKRERSQCR
jgi:hypothetical protein